MITAALIPYLLLRLRRAIKIEVLVTKLSRSNEDLGLEMAHRERAEDELRDNEERFRQMAENIREVFFLVDQEDRKLLYPGFLPSIPYGRSTRATTPDSPNPILVMVLSLGTSLEHVKSGLPRSN